MGQEMNALGEHTIPPSRLRRATPLYTRGAMGGQWSPAQCKSQKFYYIEQKPGDFLRNHPVFHFREALLFNTRVLYRNSTSWPWKSRKLSSFAELT